MGNKAIWQVELLGALRAHMQGSTIARFRTRRVGLLLAYLATYQKASHSREELAEMLWPEQDPEISRRNLRQALSSLRRHLEPPELPTGSALVVKQSRVQLSPDLVDTDVAKFEGFLHAASLTGDDERKRETLQEAVDVYKGPFLPGYFEDWVQTERLRLEDSYGYALESLAKLYAKAKRPEEAIRYLRLALAKEPLNENLHEQLMEQYLSSNRPSSAIKQYRELEHLLQAELGEKPDERARALARLALQKGGSEAESEPVVEALKQEEVGPAPEEEKPAKKVKKTPVQRLPIQLTRFYGRAASLEQASKLLTEGDRLVSVLGPAGTGKTRFTVELGRIEGDLGSWNVWFVPLADLGSAAMLHDAIIDALDARQRGASDYLEQLKPVLAGPHNLLILDNLEHILEGAVPLISRLLQDLPNASFVVTSRQSLNIEGERQLWLDPLDIPADEAVIALQEHRQLGAEQLSRLAKIPSIQLFVDRCQAIRPDFQLTPYNAATIGSICMSLEGLPLAIELAAGLSNAFTPSQILQNLRNRLQLLKSRRKDIPGRHRSLRVAIDYSYQLLDEEHRRFFSTLSVFRGGFTISTAAEVLIESSGKQGTRRRQEACLRMVLDLQERSLLKSAESAKGGEARFVLLESFREYGREQLTEQEEDGLRARHAAYFLGKLDPTHGWDIPLELALEIEQDNYHAALEYLFDKGELSSCIKIIDGLGERWSFGGPREIERATIAKMETHPNFSKLPYGERVTLLRMLANTFLYPSDYGHAREACEKALELALESGDDALVADAHLAVAVAAGYQGKQQECLDLYREGLKYAFKADNVVAQEKAYIGLGTQYWALENLPGANEAFLNAKAASMKANSGDVHWLIYYNLSRVQMDQGELDQAMQFAGESLRLSKRKQIAFGISMSLSLMSRYHWLKGDIEAAFSISKEALCKRKEVGFAYWTLNAIQFHGFLLGCLGDYEASAVLLGATFGSLRSERPADHREFHAALELAKSHISSKAFERAWAKGLAMDLEDAFEYAVQF